MSITVNFKGIPQGRTSIMQPYREAGLAFSNDKGGRWAGPIGDGGFVGPGGETSVVNVVHEQGASFDFLSLNFCNGDPNLPSQTITFTGTLATSGTVTATFETLDQSGGIATFTAQGFTNLIKLTIDLGNVGFDTFVFDSGVAAASNEG